MNPQAPISDSPWFWLLVFSTIALGAIVAVGPKYGHRQARIERQYQARERLASDAAGQNTDAVQADSRDFATSNDTLVPLWPLAIVLSAVAIVAAAMLARSSIAARRPAGERGAASSSNESAPP